MEKKKKKPGKRKLLVARARSSQVSAEVSVSGTFGHTEE